MCKIVHQIQTLERRPTTSVVSGSQYKFSINRKINYECLLTWSWTFRRNEYNQLNKKKNKCSFEYWCYARILQCVGYHMENDILVLCSSYNIQWDISHLNSGILLMRCNFSECFRFHIVKCWFHTWIYLYNFIIRLVLWKKKSFSPTELGLCCGSIFNSILLWNACHGIYLFPRTTGKWE